MAFDVQEL